MLQMSQQSNTQASTFMMMYAVLQKGYYHRNVNFQSYVDHKHQEFVSGARVCVDPPHLRVVFDKTVVNSLAPPAVAQDSAGPSNTARASRDSLSMGSDSTPPLDHDDRPAGTAATPEAAGADVDVNHAKSTQHQGGCHASEEAEPELRGRVSPSNPHTADTAWQAVLQHSMRLARDTKWTHKGLQASAASCLVIMNEEHVHDCTFAHHLFQPNGYLLQRRLLQLTACDPIRCFSIFPAVLYGELGFCC